MDDVGDRLPASAVFRADGHRESVSGKPNPAPTGNHHQIPVPFERVRDERPR